MMPDNEVHNAEVQPGAEAQPSGSTPPPLTMRQVAALSTLASQILLNHENLADLLSNPQGELRRVGIPQGEMEAVVGYIDWVKDRLEEKMAEGLNWWV